MPVDEEAAVLRAVAGCVDDADCDTADLHLVPVLDRVERVLRLGERVNAHRYAVLEREPSVSGEVIGVRVRLEDADNADAAALRLGEVRLDRVGRIHHDRLAGGLIADQVGRAAEVVVHELPKDHFRTNLSTAAASFLEVARLPLCRRITPRGNVTRR